MKVVLCHVGIRNIGFDSFYNKFDLSFNNIDAYLVPNGICYLGAALREHNHEVHYLDMRMMKGWDEIEDQLKEIGPRMVGCGFQTPNREYAIELCRIAKKLGIITIVGGPHVTCVPDDALACQEFDHIVVGEGEITLPKICDMYERGEKPKRFYQGEFVKDISSLSLPYLSPLYENVVKLKKCGFMITSRGCPGRCSFCQPVLQKIYGRKIKFRDLDHVFKELDNYINKYGVRKFFFMDDMFTTIKERVEEFTRRLREEKYDIEYDINARVDYFNETMAEQLASTGCNLISFGFESGSNAKLKLLRKNTTRERNLEVGKLWKKTGKLLLANILVGIPGETEADIEQDYTLIEELQPDAFYYNWMVPYPGTEYYNLFVQNNCLTSNNFALYEMNINKNIGLVKGVDYKMVQKWEERFENLRKKIFRRKNLSIMVKNPKYFANKVLDTKIGVLAQQLGLIK